MVIFIQEECHVVFILAVQVFLVVHVAVVVTLYQESVVNQRDGKYLFTLVVGNSKNGIIF